MIDIFSFCGSVMIDLLAKEGFVIVATPYRLSFDHTVSAQGIHARFNSCLDYLSAYGFGDLSAEEISSLPLYSVGHRYKLRYLHSRVRVSSMFMRYSYLAFVACSLGALMQVLIGSTCSGRLPQVLTTLTLVELIMLFNCSIAVLDIGWL